MNLLLLVIIFTAVGGILSVMAASLFLLLPAAQRSKILPHGLSFATGALLAVAFWGLIPHAAEEIGLEGFQWLSATILIGILSFFILEKLLVWRHCHAGECEAHGDEDHSRRVAGPLIILGDSIHNFVDGVLIAAAFLTDVQLGIVTSLAVAAHEIPQEVGDFAILLHSGYSRSKALWYNVLSSLATVLGGVLAYFSLGNMHGVLPYVIALAASSFIYIAVGDLIPTLHRKTDVYSSLQQIGLIAAGVALVFSLHGLMHEFEEPQAGREMANIRMHE
ncbi:MAG: ZIP family metal transporter [Gammaproteobacteria bacterium]